MKNRITRLWKALANAGQCCICGGWFDNWAGGTCDACRNLGH